MVYRDSFFDETVKELGGHFEVKSVGEEEAKAVIDGVGGLEAWVQKARTVTVPQ